MILLVKVLDMRADRLLSILMLLQDRGRLTAQELGEELEVSERTIYRDMVSLSAAGVPVYAERGPGGGCSLVESYRTNLTGLTRDEVRALFMLSVPAPLAELGVDEDLKAALLKLSVALPEVFRQDGRIAQKRIHLDSSVWFQEEQHIPHLRTIQQALWDDRRITLTYRLAFDAQVEHIVEPYGLVAKSNVWYLVFSRDGIIFVLKLVDVLNAKLGDENFVFPSDFDLVKFWTNWCTDHENSRPQFAVHVRMKPELLQMLKYFQDSIIQDEHEGLIPNGDGWYSLILQFENFEAARVRLLDFGGAVEVLEPGALRRSIQDYAHQIQMVYNR